jgi:PAS domain S-box-containing protein
MKILLVDDCEQNLYQLELLLGAHQYQVITAVNGADALAKARESLPNLIISDILMPVMDGFSLCREWKQDARLRRIPFIFYSATYTDDRDREFALGLGAARFIVKPEEPELFLRAVEEAIEQTVPPAPEPALPEQPSPLEVGASNEEETVYLKQYNEALIRKLEAKMQQLEQTSRELAKDIAEREEAQSRYRALFEQSPDGMVIIDPESARMLEFNEAVCRQLHYSREEFARLSLAALEASDAPDYTWQRICDATRRGRVDFETRQRTQEGEVRNILVTAQVIRLLGRSAYHCIWRDITEQKKLETQLLRAQRIEAIGALASGIAHDLNNILSPVLITASLLRETIQDPEARRMLTTIEGSAHRGADIIKQLLVFARGSPATHEPLAVGPILRDTQKIVQQTFPRDIRLAIGSAEDLWSLLGDGTQLHQVLMNLCVNARDAMPDGGRLTIMVKNVHIDDAFTSMTPGAQSGAYVCISVSDTGTGIPPEIRDYIFDPFFTTKQIGKGTGLGLATVQAIVRSHDGFIRVESQLGRGTTFELYFPATPGAQTAVGSVRAAAPPQGHGELILVVDDEDAVRDCLRRTLERYGYRVVAAAEGREALTVYSQFAGDIRAVVTDMMMPAMGGPATVEALRRIQPHLAIVGMTGFPEQTEVKGLDSLHLPAVLRKPFSGDELLRTLDSALRSQS